jgi:hypothetical protein
LATAKGAMISPISKWSDVEKGPWCRGGFPSRSTLLGTLFFNKVFTVNDAAQARGEVHKQGGDRTSNIPKGNVAPTVTDIGVTKENPFPMVAILLALAS